MVYYLDREKKSTSEVEQNEATALKNLLKRADTVKLNLNGNGLCIDMGIVIQQDFITSCLESSSV